MADKKPTLKKNNKDISRFQKQLKVHYDGIPWIDISIKGTLKGVTAKQAALKIGELNSIWQIVNHMISWRKALFGRIKDKPVGHPKDNYIWEVKDTSSAAWKKTLAQFEISQKEINTFLAKQSDELFDKISPASGYSYYELAQAITIHDTYHLGQIVLIKRLMES